MTRHRRKRGEDQPSTKGGHLAKVKLTRLPPAGVSLDIYVAMQIAIRPAGTRMAVASMTIQEKQ